MNHKRAFSCLRLSTFGLALSRLLEFGIYIRLQSVIPLLTIDATVVVCLAIRPCGIEAFDERMGLKIMSARITRISIYAIWYE